MNPSRKHPEICCITNLAPHYREAIFTLMDRELGCDFYIGDRVNTHIETMNYNNLTGFRKTLTNIPLFGKFYWQKGVMILPFKSYNIYLMTLEFQCLSTWYLLIMLKLLGKRSFLSHIAAMCQ